MDEILRQKEAYLEDKEKESMGIDGLVVTMSVLDDKVCVSVFLSLFNSACIVNHYLCMAGEVWGCY